MAQTRLQMLATFFLGYSFRIIFWEEFTNFTKQPEEAKHPLLGNLCLLDKVFIVLI